MQTFTDPLDPTSWTEILSGGTSIAFDCLGASSVELIFSESSVEPTGTGHLVQSWPAGWDFTAENMVAGTQRIWARGSAGIRGVRG